MKLKKKTVYRVKSQKAYNDMMEDCYKQGYYWEDEGDAKTHHPDKWNNYKTETCVRIDEVGCLWYADAECYENYTNYKHEEYKNTPEVFSCFGGLCVDAPDFGTAYEIFKEHINRVGALPIQNNVYTVRVEDNETTVITPNGEFATAKCHPDDDFDIVEGFRVALEKIEEANRKLTDSEKEILEALVLLDVDSISVDDDHDLVCNFYGNEIYVSIDEDDFKWFEEYESYYPQELLEKYA